MISAAGFCTALDRIGVRLVSGVPCSYFAGPLRLLESRPGRYVPAANDGAAPADEARADGRPAFVLVPKDTIEPPPAATAAPAPFGRREALSAVLPHLDRALVFTTTGYVSRELFGLCDRAETFYMQGSMGHALALGLGTALSRRDRQVLVIDGDGAVLMHTGTCLTAGALAPPNLVHLILDNGAYESTGSQCTTSSTVDWWALGAAAGYRSTVVCASAPALGRGLHATRGMPGPHLVVA